MADYSRRVEEEGRSKVIAVIPAHQESPRIAAVVRELVEQGLPVLVVDDGSADDTADQARGAGAEVLRLYPNRGKGGALKAGFTKVLEGGGGLQWDGILTLDGDGQHDPAEVPKILKAWGNTAAV